MGKLSSSPHVKPPTRTYVKVISTFDATGSVVPTDIIWGDGRIFHIDSVRDFRPASSLGNGRTGDCFTVMIQGEVKYLFFQRTDVSFGSRLARWWVETPAS